MGENQTEEHTVMRRENQPDGDYTLPRLMLTAPASGNGKTTVTIALLQAMKDRGYAPAAFKCGPDYIDPLFHREVLGVPGYNLDLFLAPPAVVRGLLGARAFTADMALLEGVMGYYDGSGSDSRASSWHLACETETPAVLVVSPGGASLSVAALVQGFARFRQNSCIRGVVLNNCALPMADRYAAMIEAECGVPVYGFLPRVPDAFIQSRYLGLVTPNEVENLQAKARRLAAALEENADVDGLLALAKQAPALSGRLPALAPVASDVCLAVARDEAFCFYYQENLEMLEALGARLAFFSPLRDECLPKGAAGLYIGGGCPEQHAQKLAGNAAMRGCLQKHLAAGMPAIAEGGGFLYLQQRLEDTGGISYAVVGALKGEGYNSRKLGRFGYVELTANTDSLLCRPGQTVKGHEFHYWDSTCNGSGFTARQQMGQVNWQCGQVSPSLYAGFPHLYFWSNPDCAQNFVRAAAAHRDSQRGTPGDV